MTRSPRPGSFRHLRNASLYAQIALLLTIAVFPIGLIALSQALNALEEARKLEAAALLGETIRVAGQESEIIDTARGVARALGSASLRPGSDTDEDIISLCSEGLAQFAERSPTYEFAGFISLTGDMACTSDGTRSDFSRDAEFALMQERPRPRARLLGQPGSQDRRLEIFEPVFDSGNLAGFMVVRLPFAGPRTDPASLGLQRSFSYALVDRTGTPLGYAGASGSRRMPLPPPDILSRQLTPNGGTFEAELSGGGIATFASATVVQNDIFVVGHWNRSDNAQGPYAQVARALLFPVSMWLAGLAVSYLAMHRLVIRHVTRLVRMMTAFESGRRNIDGLLPDAPQEIRVLGDRFASLASTITQDEMEQERALEEKTVLLREVNHRVKNNLQMVASIMNMQIRHSSSDEVRNALRRLQERVVSLSTIHTRLYTSAEFVSVRADIVLGDIVENLTRAAMAPDAAFETVLDIEPIELTPDQSVPLSLLVSETVTNAIKYGVGVHGGTLKVSFRRLEGRKATLRVSNTCPRDETDTGFASTGVGSQLIEAFAAQLYGTLRTDRTEDMFHVGLTFELDETGPAQPFAPRAG